MKQAIIIIAGIVLGLLIGSLIIGFYTPISKKAGDAVKQLDKFDLTTGSLTYTQQGEQPDYFANIDVNFIA